MTIGTPGFNGARLKEGRLARGLTAISLADLVGVSRQAISQFENGPQTPTPEVLSRISNVLVLPEHYFLTRPRSAEAGLIFYRSRSAATKTARLRCEHRYSWMLEIVDYISEFVDLPPLRLPDLDLPADPTLISSAEIEHAAEITRSSWGLHPSPIGNLLGLLESNGIITGCWALGADTLDSLSHFSASLGRPIIIVGSEKTAAVRQRFDAAHELGHMILHKSFKGEPDSALHKLMEDQAHRYAGAFLLPMSSFMDDVFAISLDALLSLKPKWRTSVGVMIKRLLQTELIEADQEQRLWINYSRRRWRSMEPYDDKLEPEEPGLIKRALEVMVHEGVQGRDDILATLDLDVSDIEDLAALPSGFFNAPAPTLTLRPKASKFDRDVGNVGLADVVQMRKGESPPRIEPA